MKTTKVPYEILFRWDQTGKIIGAHAQYRYVTKEGAKVVGESVGSAEPISLDNTSMLGEISAKINADSLIALDAATQRIVQLETELAAI